MFIQGTSLYELFLTVKQRAVLALAQLQEIDHSKEVKTTLLNWCSSEILKYSLQFWAKNLGPKTLNN